MTVNFKRIVVDTFERELLANVLDRVLSVAVGGGTIGFTYSQEEIDTLICIRDQAKEP